MAKSRPCWIQSIFFAVRSGEHFQLARNWRDEPLELFKKVWDGAAIVESRERRGETIEVPWNTEIRYRPYRRRVSAGPTCFHRVAKGAVVIVHPDDAGLSRFPVGELFVAIGKTLVRHVATGDRHYVSPDVRVIVLPRAVLSTVPCPRCAGVGWLIVTVAEELRVQACSHCSIYPHDHIAAMYAETVGIPCSQKYPCVLLKWQHARYRYRMLLEIEVSSTSPVPDFSVQTCVECMLEDLIGVSGPHETERIISITPGALTAISGSPPERTRAIELDLVPPIASERQG